MRVESPALQKLPRAEGSTLTFGEEDGSEVTLHIPTQSGH